MFDFILNKKYDNKVYDRKKVYIAFIDNQLILYFYYMIEYSLRRFKNTKFEKLFKDKELLLAIIRNFIKKVPDIDKEKTSKIKVIKGKLLEIKPTRAFFKDDGEFGFVTNIKLVTKDDVKQITVWNEKVKEIQKLRTGYPIEIKDIDIRQKNGKEELHINSKGAIKKL